MFVVNGLIGEGGFGTVYSALFTKNQQWYAMKEINKVRDHVINYFHSDHFYFLGGVDKASYWCLDVER